MNMHAYTASAATSQYYYRMLHLALVCRTAICYLPPGIVFSELSTRAPNIGGLELSFEIDLECTAYNNLDIELNPTKY